MESPIVLGDDEELGGASGSQGVLGGASGSGGVLEEGELQGSESESEREIRQLKEMLLGWKNWVETHVGVRVDGLAPPTGPPPANVHIPRVIVEEPASDSEEVDPVAVSNTVVLYNQGPWANAPCLGIGGGRNYQNQNQNQWDNFVDGFGEMLGDAFSPRPPMYPRNLYQSIVRVRNDRRIEFPLVLNSVGHMLAWFRDVCTPNLWFLNRLNQILTQRNIVFTTEGPFWRHPRAGSLHRIPAPPQIQNPILRTMLLEGRQVVRVWQQWD